MEASRPTIRERSGGGGGPPLGPPKKRNKKISPTEAEHILNLGDQPAEGAALHL